MVHISTSLLRDYTIPRLGQKDTIRRLVRHKESITSHLSWVTLWLGFHAFGIYDGLEMLGFHAFGIYDGLEMLERAKASALSSI